ncbi:MAG: IS200/IS605 family transposase [Nitrospirota bacterium]
METKNHNFKFFKTSGSTIFQNNYHIVFSTKYRRKIIGPILTKELKDIYGEIAEEKPYGIEMLGIGIEVDHIHIVVSVPPGTSIAKAVQKLKGYPSFKIFKKYPELSEKIGKRALWQTGYFCRSVGDMNIPQIMAYLDKQRDVEYLGDR